VVSFPVVTEGEFPHGLECMDCGRAINQGEPYSRRIVGVMQGTYFEQRDPGVLELVCVYCETNPGGQGADWLGDNAPPNEEE